MQPGSAQPDGTTSAAGPAPPPAPADRRVPDGARAARAVAKDRESGLGRDVGAPFLSVIVPAHDAATLLPDTLGALARSNLPREAWELIVVDDASRDDTAAVAARYADLVVRLPDAPRGPAYARNRGAEAARGEWIAFIDADVRVHRETLDRIVRAVHEDPELRAVFGSYDARPAAPGIVSRFRNLLHHYVHQQNAGPAETFWAGCGAVRRDVFLESGMYDEWHYSRPQIEDIELGRRIRILGHQIALRPDIQVTHLKRWTLREVLRTDFRNRGIPWTRLLLQEGASAASRALNLRASERFCTAAVSVGAAIVVAAAVSGDPSLLWPAATVPALVVLFNLGFYRTLAGAGGWWFAMLALPLHLAYYLVSAVSAVMGWVAHNVVGEPLPPPAVVAFREIGLQTWPPVPAPPARGFWSPEQNRARQAQAAERRGPPAALLPVHKRAFGIAVGTVTAVVVAGTTSLHLLVRPPEIELELLAQYFYGYSVSWQGAFVGAVWAFFAGFVAGWFAAFSRNLVLALSLALYGRDDAAPRSISLDRI